MMQKEIDVTALGELLIDFTRSRVSRSVAGRKPYPC